MGQTSSFNDGCLLVWYWLIICQAYLENCLDSDCMTHNKMRYCQYLDLCCLHTHTCSPQLCFNTYIYHWSNIVSTFCENMYWASLCFVVKHFAIITRSFSIADVFWISSKDLSWTQFDRDGLYENFSIFCCKHKHLFNLSKQRLSNLLHFALWLDCCSFISVYPLCISNSKYS